MTRVLREFIEAILLAVLIFFLIQASVQNFRVEGFSMQPTLEDKQMLLVNKMVYLKVDMQRLSGLVPFWEVQEKELAYPFHPPNRGDVVVFHWPLDPQRELVKRVIGVPGDTVEIRDGVVYVNGSRLQEPYLTPPGTRTDHMDPDLEEEVSPIKEGHYFVLGDNRRQSNDSRDWGLVPQENMVGKVWFVYWPPSNLSFLNIFPWRKG